jgi:magnesium chelatase accessory protein
VKELEESRWPNRHLSRYVHAAGLRWHVQLAGEGPDMLLVHGTAASTHSWRDLMPILAQRHRVLAVDLPGHGFTDRAPKQQISIAGMSGVLARLLRELAFEPQFVVGHSAGAVILCRMALDGAIQPRVIVSINGAFLPMGGMLGTLFSPFAKLLASTAFLPRLLASRMSNASNVGRVLAGTGSHLNDEGVAYYTYLIGNPRHLAGALGMMSQWDLDAFAQEMPRLTVPLALLVAGNDHAVPPRQAALVKHLIPTATLEALPGLGHLAHEERPGLVAERILQICAAYGRA